MYEVCTDDFYHDMWAMKDEFDLARYPKSCSFYDPTNNKMVGMFKHETSGQSLSEFVGLNPKMHSYQTLNDPSHGEGGLTTKKLANRNPTGGCGQPLSWPIQGTTGSSRRDLCAQSTQPFQVASALLNPGMDPDSNRLYISLSTNLHITLHMTL